MQKLHLPIILFLTIILASCDRTDLGREMSLGVAEARLGHYEQALVHATSCVAFAPENVDALLLKSFCQFMLETKPEKRRQPLMGLLKCTHLSPDRFDPWYFYGWALVETGQLREAIEPLRQALKLVSSGNPKALEVKLLLERCYIANNLVDEALRILQPLQGRLPYRNCPELFNELGIIDLKRQSPQNAVNHFLRGLELDQNNEVLLQNLAVTYDLYLNNPQQAWDYYRKCLIAKKRVDLGIQTRMNQLRRLTR